MSSLVSAWRVATCRSDFKSDSGAEMRRREDSRRVKRSNSPPRACRLRADLKVNSYGLSATAPRPRAGMTRQADGAEPEGVDGTRAMRESGVSCAATHCRHRGIHTTRISWAPGSDEVDSLPATGSSSALIW